MHDDLRNLPLTFPSIPVSERETPRNLTRLLYKGGAFVPPDQVDKAIRAGSIGGILSNRVELVYKIHEFINGELASGGSHETARRQISDVVAFFRWADSSGEVLSISEVLKTYLAYSEHLLQRVRVIRDMKLSAAYHYCRTVGQVLDGALGRDMPMVKLSRIARPHGRKTPQGGKADKQKLDATFAFGRIMQDICDGTSLRVVWAPRPAAHIPLQQGGEIEVTRGRRALPEEQRLASNIRKSNRKALKYETDRSLKHPFRRILVNLRIQAELLMFIGQTGMNLAQAQGLSVRRLSYSSDIDGYKVREYKPRRKGEVLFEIFSEYRSHFERYLEWRRELFPATEKRLFPIMRFLGARDDSPMDFDAIKSACKKAGVDWIPPGRLRGTRVNWLLRRSGDADMTAEMAQHSKQTLLKVYEVPSLQRAVSEITRFHLNHDPALAGKVLSPAVAQGECDGIPVPLAAKPEFVLEPDCRLPSGCLWCEHHRDIDSFDYVWSMACFRHLKILELSMYGPTKQGSKTPHPAQHAIERLSGKLSWFRESNATRREWVEEALARVEEGDYHDRWSLIIAAVEGRSK